MIGATLTKQSGNRKFHGNVGPFVTIIPTDTIFLKLRKEPVDIPCMIDFELEELALHRDWQQVLGAYRACQDAAQTTDPEHDGWVPRINLSEGVSDEHLPRIHGKLIALGFLKFQLVGRTAGMHYQLSSQGARAMEQFHAAGHYSPDAIDLTESA